MTTTPDDPTPPHPHVAMLAHLNEEFLHAPLAPVEPPKGPLTIDLPSVVLSAGRWTALGFFLGWESFITSWRWAPGFRIRNLRIGLKDFGDGTGKVDGRYYTQHRVLKAEQILLEIENTTNDDRKFSGTITIEVSQVAEPTELSCSIDLPADAHDATLPGLTSAPAVKP